jgi:hypothetical protein
MTISASGVRRLLALAALGPVTAAAAACGTSSSSSSPGSTVTVTVPPSSGGSAPASTPSTPQGSTPAGPAECTTAALHVKIGSGNGAAGTIYYDVVFTDVGSATCLLQGYPGVSLVSAASTSGSQIGADAKRDSVTPSVQITLAAGQTAHAVLGVAEAGNFPASKCNPVNAHWLKVFPPDQTVAAYAPFTTQTCASTSVPTMRITTISSGA